MDPTNRVYLETVHFYPIENQEISEYIDKTHNILQRIENAINHLYQKETVCPTEMIKLKIINYKIEKLNNDFKSKTESCKNAFDSKIFVCQSRLSQLSINITTLIILNEKN